MKKTILWYGDFRGIGHVRNDLLNADIKYIESYEELTYFLSAEIDDLIFIIDLPDLSEEEIKKYSKLIYGNKLNKKMVFFFNEGVVPDLKNVRDKNHLFFLHRYDLFALRGFLAELALGPDAYIRKEMRTPLRQVFEFKQADDSLWDQGIMQDLSDHGVKIRITKLNESEKLKVKDRIQISFKNIKGNLLTRFAEVRWVKENSQGYTSGLKFIF